MKKIVHRFYFKRIKSNELQNKPKKKWFKNK